VRDHRAVARLTAKERAKLPDRAFAYIDSEGNRRLPIHDASHVRNALARFSQVQFEDDSARERARTRLLNAAKRHGIMPIGFLSSQLRPQLKLPTGHVTFLMTDLERSTELLSRLGDGYGSLIAAVRRLIAGAVRSSGGHRVDSRGDDFLAVFKGATEAVEAAIAIQRAILAGPWPGATEPRLRIGLHGGRPTLTDHGYVGLSVHAVARICFAGHGGQVLLSGTVHDAAADSLDEGINLRSLGSWRFDGLPEPIAVYQANEGGGSPKFPPLRSGARATGGR
jgi:class 3 adenylate cyclase